MEKNQFEKENNEELEEQSNIPGIEPDEFLKVLEHIEKELHMDQSYKASIRWYINLIIQLVFLYGLGLSLMMFLNPFKLGNNYILYIYLALVTLSTGTVKIYTHKTNKAFILLFHEYIDYIFSLLLSIIIAVYLPGIIDIDFIMLVIYLLAMLVLNNLIGNFFKKFIRGNYDKTK